MKQTCICSVPCIAEPYSLDRLFLNCFPVKAVKHPLALFFPAVSEKEH